jgi:AraC-like DNA-binding protein
VPGDVVKAMGRAYRPVATQGMTPHQHGIWEIHLLVEGRVTWFAGSNAYELSAGSVLLIPPGLIHGSVVGRFEPSDLAWVQIDFGGLEAGGPPARRLAEDEASGTAGTSTLRRTWVDPNWRRLLSLHEAMMDECRDPSPHSARLMTDLAAVLVGYVAREACLTEPPTSSRPLPPALRSMLEHLERHLDRRVTLRELCALTGLSRGRVHGLFREHLGQSPGTVALERRLQRGQHLLRETGGSIGRISLSLGFSSSQHFATAFRNRFGVSPSSFRETCAQQNG